MAVAIIGVALLFLVALLAHEARLTARAAGQREAYMLLDAAIEGLRAGAIPLETATYTDPAPPWLPIPRRRGAALWITVEPAPDGIDDLYLVTAAVRYRTGRDLQARSMTTKIWKRASP